MGTLLPVLAALAGVVAQFKPLESARPSVSAALAVPLIAEQDVDARLWQDPIAVAQKQKAALLGDMTTGALPKGHDALCGVDTLVRLLQERHPRSSSRRSVSSRKRTIAFACEARFLSWAVSSCGSSRSLISSPHTTPS